MCVRVWEGLRTRTKTLTSAIAVMIDGFFRSAHRNVKLLVSIAFLESLSNSIWAGTFLSAYLLEKTGGSNLGVGAIEAVSGVTELIAALPIGWLADKLGKARIGKIGMTLGVSKLAVLATAIVLQVSASRALMLFTIGMVIDGFVEGFIDGPFDALLADSVRSGQRSTSYFVMSVARNIARTTGPAITIMYFSLSSNVWHIHSIEIVILIGLSLSLPLSVMSWFLVEADADADAAERRRRRSSSSSSLSSKGADDDKSAAPMPADAATEKTPLLLTDVNGDAVNDAKCTSLDDDVAIVVVDASTMGVLRRWRWLVPYLLIGGDFLDCIASGMTVRFFPLWWKQDVRLTPVGVQIINLISPLAVIASSSCSVLLSRKIGRVQVCMLWNGLGAGALALLVVLYRRGVSVPILALVYIIRNMMVRGTYAVEESVLMDAVPRHMRYVFYDAPPLLSMASSWTMSRQEISNRGQKCVFCRCRSIMSLKSQSTAFSLSLSLSCRMHMCMCMCMYAGRAGNRWIQFRQHHGVVRLFWVGGSRIDTITH